VGANDARGVRPGYGWAVGAFGFAFLGGFLGWLAIVMSNRIRRTSTDIVWQATLAVAIAAAAVAVLLAVGAFRRGGGVLVARIAAVIAVASAVVSPIGVALARPSTPYVRISAFAASDGMHRWTDSPHLVDAYTVRSGPPGTIIATGESSSGLCDTNPAQATIATATGAIKSLVTNDVQPGELGFTGSFVIGIGGARSTPRSPNAAVDITIGYEASNGGPSHPVLQATDTTTGAVRWQAAITNASLGTAPITPLWVDDNVVIAASLATGPSDQISVGSGTQATPTTTAVPPPVVLGSGSSVIALDAATGTELWRAHVGSPGEPVAAAAGPAGVAVATSTVLTLRSLDTGSVLATTPLPGGALAASSDSGGITSNPLIVSGNTIAVVTSDSELTAYDASLSPRWHQHLAIRHDPAALQLGTAGDAIYTIDQTADPTSGC
jgi:outer membrane protein assembly factor BamB